VAATLQEVITRDPVPPSRLNAKVPRDLETVCLKCLHKEPQRRYPSAVALADDLRRFGEGRPIQARPVGWAERSWRWGRRNPTAAALLALILLTAGGGLWLGRQKAERQGRAREAVEAALAQVPDLRRQGRWAEAEAVLTQARSRLEEADADDLGRQLAQAKADLRLAATLERKRTCGLHQAAGPAMAGAAVRPPAHVTSRRARRQAAWVGSARRATRGPSRASAKARVRPMPWSSGRRGSNPASPES
jgi:serine/threonine-protein kinase